jgi:hypothetical protein
VKPAKVVAMGQTPTHASQLAGYLFDNIVSEREQRRANVEAKRPLCVTYVS